MVKGEITVFLSLVFLLLLTLVGGIYHLCERCGWMPGNDGNCYVTDYGDRYHTSLSCSGLKRKVYTVPLSEVKGKGACSKCGGK